MFSLNITTTEPQNEVLFDNFHFLQSSFWAEFKSHHGWTKYKFFLELKGSDFFADGIYPIFILVRSFKRLFSIAYVPLAPVLIKKSDNNSQNLFEFLDDENYLKEYLDIVRKCAHFVVNILHHNLLFMRFDLPLIYINDENFIAKDSDKLLFKKYCKNIHFKKPVVDIQPPDTVLLNLEYDDETLLANMKPKWRYNIRLAEKKGVKIQCCGVEAIDTFYKLYEETSKRDGIALHSKSYYYDLFETAEKMRSIDSSNPKISMYLATFNQEPLAAIITLFSKKMAVYLYGASSNNYRNLMPAYLLQWNAIRDAKNYGCKIYDFYGIPPTDDKNHSMYGLYRFKTGFGGSIIHRVGSIDMSFSPFYFLYSNTEKLRFLWYKKIKKIFIRKRK